MRETARIFLKAAGWANATASPMVSDLSARSYLRLIRNDQTAVLMDAGSDHASTRAFQSMTGWLQTLGLSVPEIFAAQPKDGLLLLEDLGTISVSKLLAEHENAPGIYERCMPLLLAIRHATAPALPCPSARELCDWTKLADAHYPGANAILLGRFRAGLETILAEMLELSVSVSLRDFHVDNMMWLPERKGVQRLGLLDYQDAFLTHPVYDLVSLLTDARTDVPRDVRQRFIERYAELSGDDHATLSRAFAAFSVQRNLRILGIFHRSAQAHGKAHHLPKVPRVYGYLTEAMEHPVFDDLRPVFAQALPRPKGAT